MVTSNSNSSIQFRLLCIVGIQVQDSSPLSSNHNKNVKSYMEKVIKISRLLYVFFLSSVQHFNFILFFGYDYEDLLSHE